MLTHWIETGLAYEIDSIACHPVFLLNFWTIQSAIAYYLLEISALISKTCDSFSTFYYKPTRWANVIPCDD